MWFKPNLKHTLWCFVYNFFNKLINNFYFWFHLLMQDFYKICEQNFLFPYLTALHSFAIVLVDWLDSFRFLLLLWCMQPYCIVCATISNQTPYCQSINSSTSKILATEAGVKIFFFYYYCGLGNRIFWKSYFSLEFVFVSLQIFLFLKKKKTQKQSLHKPLRLSDFLLPLMILSYTYYYCRCCCCCFLLYCFGTL